MAEKYINNSGAKDNDNPKKLVTPDDNTVARVMLRKVMSEEDPLKKWHLLSAVEILQGRSLELPAPELARCSSQQPGEGQPVLH